MTRRRALLACLAGVAIAECSSLDGHGATGTPTGTLEAGDGTPTPETAGDPTPTSVWPVAFDAELGGWKVLGNDGRVTVRLPPEAGSGASETFEFELQLAL